MPKHTKVKDVFSHLQRREARLAQSSKDGGSKSLTPSDAMATVHPRSRKVIQLQRCKIRERKMNSHKSERKNNDSLLDRLEWLKRRVNMEIMTTEITISQLHTYVEEYLNRFLPEEEEIRASLRSGRPRPKRLDEIDFIRKMEFEEYRGAGIELPNIISPIIFELFKVWDGLKESIKELEIKRFKKQK